MEVPVSTGVQVVVTGNVHKRQHFFIPNSGPPATRTLRSAGLLGCELEWQVPEQTLKGLCLTTSKLLPCRLIPTLATIPGRGLPRRLDSQGGALNWRPQHQETWRFHVTFPRPSSSEGRATIPWVLQGLWSQPEDTRQYRSLNEGTLPDVMTPPQSGHRDQASTGSRDGIGAHVMESRGNETDTSFISFSFL